MRKRTTIEIVRKPLLNPSAKERRNKLFCALDGVLRLSYKKITAVAKMIGKRRDGKECAL